MPQLQEEQLIINLYRSLMDAGFTYSQLEKMIKADDYVKFLQLVASGYPTLKNYGVTPEQFMRAFSQISIPEVIAVLDRAIEHVLYLHICDISENDICNLINHFKGLDKLPCVIKHYRSLEILPLSNHAIVRILVNNQPETLPELVASFKCFKALDFDYLQISQVAQKKQALQRVNMMMALYDESLAKLRLTKADIVKIFASDSWRVIVEFLHDNVNNILEMQKEDLFLSALVITDTELKALETKIRQWQYRDVDDPQSSICVDEDSIGDDPQDYVTTAIEGNGLFAERKPPAREALTGGFQCPSLVNKWHVVRF